MPKYENGQKEDCHQQMMHYWNLLWDWNTLDSVRAVHSFLEGWALVFFGLLVLFDVLAHFSDENKPRAKKLEKIGLVCFAVAVLAEAFAYPYSRRNDTLASQQDTEQKAKIAALDNSTQRLRTDADNARKQAEGFKAQIADSNARAKAAEAQVATAMAASADAVAKVAGADARSAEASAKAEGFRLDIAKANEGAARATETAERERLARLQLEARLADRIFTPDQQRRCTSALTPSKGITVDVSVFGDTLEIANFSASVLGCLRQAGLLVNTSNPIGGGTAARGVLVGVKPGAPPAVTRIADVLIAILRESVGPGVGPWDFDKLISSSGASMVSQATGADKVGEAPIRLFIGSK